MKTVLIAAFAALLAAQEPAPRPDAFIAFRVDESHVIAVLDVGDYGLAVVSRTTTSPVASFGFAYADADAAVRERVSPELRDIKEWSVDVAAGRTIGATAERIVVGDVDCVQATGMLLTVAPADIARFKAMTGRYFVAAPARASRTGVKPSTTLGALPVPVLQQSQRAQLESMLNDLLKREFPAMRVDASIPEYAKMAEDDVGFRSWLATVRRIDEAVARGNVRLTYDVQAFRLDPTGVPIWFVRAEWLTGQQQAFGAALWIRAAERLQLIESDTAPASWLRNSEFQGKVEREHFGLVLTVLDRDHDGWGEVMMEQSGYESFSIFTREFSADGFRDRGLSYTAGC